jgi:hypothetical protein
MHNVVRSLLDFAPLGNKRAAVASTIATTLVVSELARRILNPVPKQILPSPRASILPKLSKKEQEELPYPPDVFPGARDVASPVS